ncbi:MAG: hypothetical protein JWR67_2149 [Mucilaginibacter sp.]|nr:hypothetical protein [Mucilaginibacter sp.]
MLYFKNYPRCKALIFLFLFTLSASQVKAQQQITPLKSMIGKIDDYNTKLPSEKLFLQFDKPYYAVGDTIWFKGYLTNSILKYSALSSRLYVDLVNDSNRVVKHFVFPVSFGLSWGNIELNESIAREGAYTIRAYTNWMRNFDENTLFYQSFYVSGLSANSWIINTRSTLNNDQVKADLKFTGLDQKPLGGQDLELKLVNGKKTLLKNSAVTAADGTLNINFTVPVNTPLRNLAMVASVKKDNKKSAWIPLNINRPQDVDIQFMPESGPLIASLPAQVGFKSIGEDGRGINVKGIVTDNENNTVGQFESLHAGMGVFNMAPQPGKTYTAQITLPDGTIKTVKLPAIKKSGTLLKIRNSFNTDTLHISVLASEDIISPGLEYHIIGESRGVVCYGASFKLNKQFLNLSVPKSLFPTGVAHFTIINSSNQPVNERLAFINNDDNLKIDIKTASSQFSPRDSIPLHITVNDQDGQPIMGSFSIAVTDDAQIKNGTADRKNILTDLLLTSDLNGYVEDPEFYLEKSALSWKALDALLLTQGWVGYNWKYIINGAPAAQYAPEPDYAINGKVTNLLNKPVSNSKILLLATGRYHFIKDTITNTEGKFSFHKIPAADSTKYVLQARNAGGRTINAGITVNEVPALNTNIPFDIIPAPWYVNADTTLLNYVKNNSAYHDELERRKYGGHLLREVNIKDKTEIKGSQNLNGTGNSDQVITEADIEKVGKASLLDLIQQKVTSFHSGYVHKGTDLEFFLKDKRVRFVIDGIDLDRYYEPFSATPNEHYEYQKQTLDYLTASDILGIEVMYSSRYNSAYNTQNLSLDEQLAVDPTGPRGSSIAYLEITTRSGNGPFTRTATGIYIYKPVPFTMSKQFYRPRYLVKNTTHSFTDLRSTIHWQPSIVTDKNGQATVSFYAADKPTTYTIIMEGSDLNGKIGYQTKKITIAPATK